MRKLIGVVAAAGALAFAGVSSSCSGGGGGGTGGGGGSGGSSGGTGGSAGGAAGGAAGGFTETADADAGLCNAGMFTCTFEDDTAADAGRTVQFGTTNPGAAVPECMRVKVGQTVKFVTGAFHPIAQDCGPKNGKLTAPESATTNITFGVAGDYAYHCGIHLFPGAIRVVP